LKGVRKEMYHTNKILSTGKIQNIEKIFQKKHKILWFCRETSIFDNLQKTRILDSKWQSKNQSDILCNQKPQSKHIFIKLCQNWVYKCFTRETQFLTTRYGVSCET